MTNTIAVSSYSLRQLLGPLSSVRREADGSKSSHVWSDNPQTMTLLELPAQIRERLGLDAIEICQFHLPEHTPEYLDQLKGALADAGVRLIAMPIDVGNISDPNPDYREEDLQEIESWMRIAAELGAKLVRVNAGYVQAATEPHSLDVTIASYKRLAQTAASLGLQVLIENHGGITADPEVIVQLVEGVGRDQLHTLVDIGNFEPYMSAVEYAIIEGKEPADVDLTPLYTAIARVAPFAGMVHAKTHEFDADGNPLYLDVVRALSIVRDTGYTGPLSVEYEGTNGDPWENTRRTLALVQEVFA